MSPFRALFSAARRSFAAWETQEMYVFLPVMKNSFESVTQITKSAGRSSHHRLPRSAQKHVPFPQTMRSVGAGKP